MIAVFFIIIFATMMIALMQGVGLCNFITKYDWSPLKSVVITVFAALVDGVLMTCLLYEICGISFF